MIFINSNNKAVNKLNGKPKAKPAKCPKTPTSSRSRETAIENMIKERLAFMDRANTERNLNDSRIDARNNLKSYCYNLVETLENESINKDDKRLLMKYLNLTLLPFFWCSIKSVLLDHVQNR